MEDLHIYIIIGIAVAIVIVITVIVSCCLWKRKVCKRNAKNDVENQATNEPNQESHHEFHSNTAFQASTPELQSRQQNRKRFRGKRQRSQLQEGQKSQSNSWSRTALPEKTIDLHNLSVRDAMQQFIAFVRHMEEIYLDNNFSRKDRFFYVITGRGKHSHDGIPKIKPAVQGYLDKHDYVHEWSNKGRVMIDLLSKRDLLSENLQLL